MNAHCIYEYLINGALSSLMLVLTYAHFCDVYYKNVCTMCNFCRKVSSYECVCIYMCVYVCVCVCLHEKMCTFKKCNSEIK
jgi:hypothetical protein